MLGSWKTWLTAACVVLTGQAAFAQGSTGVGNPRVFGNLFGGATDDGIVTHAVDFTGALFLGYDDDVLSRRIAPRPGQAQLSGTYTGVQGSLSYRRPSPRGSFSATASGAGRYVTSSQEMLTTFAGASAGYSRALSPSTGLVLQQGVAYRPFFSVLPFEGGSTLGPSLEPGVDDGVLDVADGGDVPAEDLSIASSREALLYRGAATVSRALTPASSLSFGAGYASANFRNAEIPGAGNLRWRVFGRYSRQLTQYASLRLGYGYRKLRADGSGRDANHDIDVGINYAQPFTFGRGRTTLSFSTGTAFFVRDRPATDGGSGNRVTFRALGRATLRHDFAAPWQAQLSYVRALRFVDGINEAFLSDRVVGAIGGLLGRRTDVTLTVGYLTGAFGASRRNFDTLNGSLRLRTAVSRNVAVFAQYYYFQYLFDEDFATALIVPPEVERQGVRGGLTVWLPLFRR